MKVLLQKIKNVIKTFAGAQRGSLPILIALVAPVLFVLIGGGIEYSKIISQKNMLQGYADRAALAAAKEFSISQDDDERVKAIAKAVVNSALTEFKETHANSFMASPIKVDVKIDNENATVKVSLTQGTIKNFPVRGFDIKTVSVDAEASVVGSLNVCVVGLHENATNSIYLENSAKLTGFGCAVYSNSTSYSAISAGSDAKLTASLICSAGGQAGGKGSYTPVPMTDCPLFDDPLSERPTPDVGECDYGKLSETSEKQEQLSIFSTLGDSFTTFVSGTVDTDRNFIGTKILDETITLQPGTYCGGLAISGNSKVTFAAGIYILKDGPLAVQDTSSVVGLYTGFYFTGTGAIFNFEKNTDIDLSAPRDGIMAGLLMFEDRESSFLGIHSILSNSARNLLGTIYLYNSTLLVDSDAPVAQESAYTALVVRKLHLRAGPHLILNTRYSETDVPVPANIKGLSSNVRLTQ